MLRRGHAPDRPLPWRWGASPPPASQAATRQQTAAAPRSCSSAHGLRGGGAAAGLALADGMWGGRVRGGAGSPALVAVLAMHVTPAARQAAARDDSWLPRASRGRGGSCGGRRVGRRGGQRGWRVHGGTECRRERAPQPTWMTGGRAWGCPSTTVTQSDHPNCRWKVGSVFIGLRPDRRSPRPRAVTSTYLTSALQTTLCGPQAPAGPVQPTERAAAPAVASQRSGCGSRARSRAPCACRPSFPGARSPCRSRPFVTRPAGALPSRNP